MLRNATEVREASKGLKEAIKMDVANPDPDISRVARFYGQAYEQCRLMSQDERENINLGSLFENFVPDGKSVLTSLRHRSTSFEGTFGAQAFEAIDTSHFRNLTKSVLMAEVMESIEAPKFIGWDLVEKKSTPTPYEEIFRGVGRLSDEAQKTGETKSYPRIGLVEEKVTLPEVDKDGFIIDISQELSDLDTTGKVLEIARSGADSLGITIEKETLNAVTGITDLYRRNDGPIQPTYGNTHTQGDGDNLIASNAFTNWTSIDAGLSAFDLIIDPNTGDPVDISGDIIILVPRALLTTVRNTLWATQLQLGARESGTAGVSVTLPQPMNSGRGDTFTVKSNQWVSRQSGSTTTWFMGIPNKTFRYRQYWPARVTAAPFSYEMWEKDIAFSFKANRYGGIGIKDWRYMQKHTG